MGNHICGVHAVYEALISQKQPLERILVARETHSPKVKEILELARRHGVPVRREDRAAIDRIASGAVHQGIVAIGGEFTYAPFNVLLSEGHSLIVALDGVEDPHNLGAVIRTAEACGVTGVIVTERHSAPVSATVIRAAAGASAYVPVVRVKNLVSAVDELKKNGVWIIGVDPSAERSWTDFDYKTRVALVFGGEHKGLRRLVREHCDVLVRLPMQGKIASLNISVAAGAVLYEVVRQRARL
jgi:23S rRNA (guanosine2251-2'-O)-methyltransferase